MTVKLKIKIYDMPVEIECDTIKEVAILLNELGREDKKREVHS